MKRGEGEVSALPEERKLTIALLGGGAAGKSSLIVRLLRDEFVESDENDPTLLDEYELVFNWGNRDCT